MGYDGIKGDVGGVVGAGVNSFEFDGWGGSGEVGWLRVWVGGLGERERGRMDGLGGGVGGYVMVLDREGLEVEGELG